MSDDTLSPDPTDEPVEEEATIESGRQCPAAAILAGISVGILAGVAIAIALRPPARRAALARTIHDSGERLAGLLDNAASELRKPLERTCSMASDARSRASKALEKFGSRKKRCCFWS